MENKSISWFSLVGLFTSFLGCFIFVSLDLSSHVVELLPKIKKVDLARRTISQERSMIEKIGRVYIKYNEKGFYNLLEIIEKNKGKFLAGKPYIIYIQISIGILTKGLQEELKIIYLGYKNKEDEPVVFLHILDEWIKNYKTQLITEAGFRIILLGFLLSVLSHWFRPRKLWIVILIILTDLLLIFGIYSYTFVI